MKTNIIRNQFHKLEIDSLLVTKIENIRYLTGFTGSSAAVLITENEAVLITDSRYTEQAIKETSGFDIRTCKRPFNEIIHFTNNSKFRSLGFEADNIGFGEYTKIKENMNTTSLARTNDIVEELRIVKDQNEIKKIRSAIQIAQSAFEETLSSIRPGVSEHDISVELEYKIRKNGAEAIAFDFIVASGERGGFPHGIATHKKLANRELVTIDFGAKTEGYFSDCTRTLSVGDWDKKKLQTYEIVLSAQKLAIESIRPGVSVHDVDERARSFITKAGYGDKFGHGTGHGVGLEIHEAPRVASEQKVVLKEGMVITIEPGIYLPNQYGVRIEDMVLVTKDGYEILTSSIPKTE